jgi:predicted ribosomally synthesized peptide with SipW-like signal peptide
MVLALIVSMGLSVYGTLAYLSDHEQVVNTFTVGMVDITLDETDVDNSRESTTTDGRDKKNKYHLMPGKEYTKDPIVHVDAESENCWLFVKLENSLSAIITGTSIETQMTNNGWILIPGTTNVYARAAANAGGDNVPVFESFKIDETITDLSAYSDAVITVTAYAVQAEGFATAADAWTATFGK